VLGTDYLGCNPEFGKQDNCQMAVMLLVARDHVSPPIALQLYPPEAWTSEKTWLDEWLLIKWPVERGGPTKYWLSTLPR
jgi:SRSO17 transposase